MAIRVCANITSGRARQAGRSMSDGTAQRRSLSPDDRKLLVASIGVLVAVFALVSSNVAANHSPKPHSLPIGVVGTPAVGEAARAELARAAPGAFEVHAFQSLTTARTAVLHRSVYGAFQPVPATVLLVASAASPPVAALLQRTFASVASRSGRVLAVRDLVPLPSSDSSGATTFSAVLSLIIAGLAGTTVIFMLTRHRPEAVRVVLTVVIGVAAGLITALVTNVLVGAFPDHFFQVWGVATLFVLAIGLPIAAFQVIFGIPGTVIGAVLFLVIGNPASGGSSAPELLPGLLANPQSNPATGCRRHLHARCRLLQRPRELSRPNCSCGLRGPRRGGRADRVQTPRSPRSGHGRCLNGGESSATTDKSRSRDHALRGDPSAPNGESDDRGRGTPRCHLFVMV